MEQPSDMEKEKGREIGRNEPCPCGSGKKYKRCCGVGAAPKLGTVSNPMAALGGAEGMSAPGGFDPSQMDPAMIMKFTEALQRLPKGQMQRLQALMQKAMAGRDVTREAAEFERTLPAEFRELMSSFQMPGRGEPAVAQGTVAPEAAPAATMTPEEARRIVEEAAAAGKISSEQAESLLSAPLESQAEGQAEAQGEESKGGFSKLWKKVTGK